MNFKYLLYLFKNRLDGRTVNAHASCPGGQELVSQRPAKSYTALQTQVAVLPWRYDTEIGTVNSLNISA